MTDWKVRSLFPLQGSDPVLYTGQMADIIVDLKTGKEYIKGEPKLFYKRTGIPKTIEETDRSRWKFIYNDDEQAPGNINYVKEIWVNGLFRK